MVTPVHTPLAHTSPACSFDKRERSTRTCSCRVRQLVIAVYTGSFPGDDHDLKDDPHQPRATRHSLRLRHQGRGERARRGVLHPAQVVQHVVEEHGRVLEQLQHPLYLVTSRGGAANQGDKPGHDTPTVANDGRFHQAGVTSTTHSELPTRYAPHTRDICML